jgi:Tn3 transposase DDE domain/Domain of unknown function (DUF4158)
MARRTVLTGRQRDVLLALPADEPTLLQHHVLNDIDLGHIRRRRRPQNRLAVALREIGRVERTLFLLDWLADRDLQRRVQIGLNKGEAHHALKRAISFHRRGEIRDRTSDGQHHRIAALNLLAAIIIYWNSWKLGEVLGRMMEAGQAPAPDLLPHVSPLGWEHINLTGEYRWRSLR